MYDNTKVTVSTREGRRILTIEVDLDTNYGLTDSQKALLVTTSGGWKPLAAASEYALTFMVTKRPGGMPYKVKGAI